jgi:nucleoid DNA-binding protein
MKATVGVAMLRRLIVEKSGVDSNDVDKVLKAQADVIRGSLATGAKVRFLDGWLVVSQSKPTRRRHPKTGEMVDVPAVDKVVYREPKPRTGAD